MLEMQPKWKNRKDKKIDYVACVAGVRKGGVGARPLDLLPISPFSGGGGVLLGILGGGVPLGSPNPDPISDQKM